MMHLLGSSNFEKLYVADSFRQPSHLVMRVAHWVFFDERIQPDGVEGRLGFAQARLKRSRARSSRIQSWKKMAKGQKRSNREIKKPKLKKSAPVVSSATGIMTKGITSAANTQAKKK